MVILVTFAIDVCGGTAAYGGLGGGVSETLGASFGEDASAGTRPFMVVVLVVEA